MTTKFGYKSFLVSLLVVVFLGAVGGMSVYWITTDSAFRSLSAASGGAGVGVLYALIMGGCLFFTGKSLFRYVPLQSRRSVAIHVIVQSVITLGSFFLATWILKGALGDKFPMGYEPLFVIGLVAFSLAIVGNGLLYIFSLYQTVQVAKNATMQAELTALRAKINPHFLFNALNSIASLIRLNPAKAEAVTEDLADLFRYSLRASEQQLVTLEDELRSVELYLSIERARFSDRLTTSIEVPDELRRILIPSLILQPLVENAIKHGVGQTNEQCAVTVGASESRGVMRIIVSDSGPGFGNKKLDEVLNDGTGLRNVRDRLMLQFGPAASQLSLVPNGVVVQFPLQRDPAAKPILDDGKPVSE
ncbi:MAG: histidine kinase [Rhodothermales bacterium]|nr:histidine kinase [Rhodothermales bacterium]